MIYLLDTNACSLLARNMDAGLRARCDAHAGRLALSAVVWYELVYGRERAPHLPQIAVRLAGLRELFPCLMPFDEGAAEGAARVRAALESLKPNAQPIGPMDTLIAGHALSLPGCVLVTHNTRELRRVRESAGLALDVEDWQTVH